MFETVNYKDIFVYPQMLRECVVSSAKAVFGEDLPRKRNKKTQKEKKRQEKNDLFLDEGLRGKIYSTLPFKAQESATDKYLWV